MVHPLLLTYSQFRCSQAGEGDIEEQLCQLAHYSRWQKVLRAALEERGLGFINVDADAPTYYRTYVTAVGNGGTCDVAAAAAAAVQAVEQELEQERLAMAALLDRWVGGWVGEASFKKRTGAPTLLGCRGAYPCPCCTATTRRLAQEKLPAHAVARYRRQVQPYLRQERPLEETVRDLRQMVYSRKVDLSGMQHVK